MLEERLPYDFVVVDEAQDVVWRSSASRRHPGRQPAGRPLLRGDLGQRILQVPVSWRWLGVDIRGRSGMRIDRTSHQIRAQADRLLNRQLSDVDGNKEERGGTFPFNGPAPLIRVLGSTEEESAVG